MVVPGKAAPESKSLVSNPRRNGEEESTVCIPGPSPTGRTSAQPGRLDVLVLVIDLE